MDIFELNGEKIREYRDSLNWTRELLSEKSGIPYGTIKQIETGETENPGLNTLIPILRAMEPFIPEISADPNKRSDLLLRLFAAVPTLDDTDLESITRLAEAGSSKSASLSKAK